MKFDIIRQQVFTSLVTLLVMCLLGACVLIWGRHASVELIVGSSLFADFTRNFQDAHTVWSSIITALLLFLSATHLGRVVSTQNILGRAASIHIPLMGVLFWSVVLSDNYLTAALVTALSTQMLSGFILSVHSRGYLGHLFNATLALSLLPMFYTSAVVMWAAMPLILVLMGITLREWIISIMGLLFPFAAVSYIYWLCGEELLYVGRLMLEMFFTHTKLIEFDTILLFRTSTLILTLLLSLVSFIWFNENILRNKARLRMIAIVLSASLLSLFSLSSTFVTFAMLAPSASILLSYSVVHMQGRVANVLYFTLLILLLFSMFTPLYLPLERLISLLPQ